MQNKFKQIFAENLVYLHNFFYLQKEREHIMLNRYLTISEFAKLRNVSIGSLRYYEKLKILVPARIDPKTKYRYYLPEQISVLDTITLCTLLGIPLKNLKEYIDKNGNLDEKRILESGKKAMQEQISAMQTGVEITQFNLNNMNQNQKYSSRKGIYTRRIEERFFIEAPFYGNWNDLTRKEKAAMDLFHYAQEQDMAPVFPAGILIHCKTTPVSYSFFVQVLHPSTQDEQVIRIPETDFSCMQIDVTHQTNILDILRENFKTKELNTVIISNMPLHKSSFNSRHSEIQIPIEHFSQ